MLAIAHGLTSYPNFPAFAQVSCFLIIGRNFLISLPLFFGNPWVSHDFLSTFVSIFLSTFDHIYDLVLFASWF